MLIRSQDKEMLFELGSRVLGVSQDNAIVSSETLMASPSSICVIARYSAKEKALKVLDMISNTYAGSCYTDKEYNGMYQCSTVIKNNVVFEIPQDKDVTV